MLIGFLLPLLRRFSARKRALISAAVMAAGVALATAMVLQGHAHRGNALPIRLGLLLALAGLVLFVSSVRAGRQKSRQMTSRNAATLARFAPGGNLPVSIAQSGHHYHGAVADPWHAAPARAGSFI